MQKPQIFRRLGLLVTLAGSLLLATPTTEGATLVGAVADQYGGRTMVVYVPSHVPTSGTALVVVLHGGLGNAQRIESDQAEHGLNMDAVAEQDGFIVAYLNGTSAAWLIASDRYAWNAGGGCCGKPATMDIDDVAYIQGAVVYLVGKYGIDPSRVFGIGHSNGAMMTQRLMCETNLYRAAVAISGPLNVASESCPAAHGKSILAIHGVNDENVPVAGGRGTKGLSSAISQSEEHTLAVYTRSGAHYELQLVQGVDHNLAHINAAIRQAEGRTIAEKAAQYFGLTPNH
jgi:polyhydroxybutyrate depolymerase